MTTTTFPPTVRVETTEDVSVFHVDDDHRATLALTPRFDNNKDPWRVWTVGPHRAQSLRFATLEEALAAVGAYIEEVSS